jgi:hypothetical protein
MGEAKDAMLIDTVYGYSGFSMNELLLNGTLEVADQNFVDTFCNLPLLRKSSTTYLIEELWSNQVVS